MKNLALVASILRTIRGRQHESAAVVSIALFLSIVSFHVAAQRAAPPNAPLLGVADLRRRVTVNVLEDPSPGVLTYHNDWARTGQNLQETALTPRSVTPDRFGLLKTDFRLDGYVLAQPLYVPNVSINGTSYNVVIVVTEHDTVYGFDADVEKHPQNWAAPLWVRSLLTAGATPVPTGDQHSADGHVCRDIKPEIGITSTPVVDPQTGTLYVVAKSKEADQSYAYTLHALDVATGRQNLSVGGPVRIDAADFNALRANQRSGLALVDGVVYVAFASYCDQTPYHGWLFGYDTTNDLQQVVAFNTTPGSNYGGIWTSGAAPAIDTDGSMFLATGNGPYDPAHKQWGDSILKLPVDRQTIRQPGQFRVLDFFAPFNQEFLFHEDVDLGSGGMMIVPDEAGRRPRIAIGGGKQGLMYVIDRDRMTVDDRHQGQCSDDAELQTLAKPQLDSPVPSYTETCDPIIQAFKIVKGSGQDPTSPSVYRGPGVFSTPAYWNGHVYVGAGGDNLKMFAINGSMLVNRPVSMSPNAFRWPGVTASVSANGNQNAVVWVTDSGDVTSTPAVLHAFDATNLSRVLYKSSGSSDDERNGISAPGGRDAMTVGVRFTLPTIYGGKVFVATRTRLHVFGLL